MPLGLMPNPPSLIEASGSVAGSPQIAMADLQFGGKSLFKAVFRS